MKQKSIAKQIVHHRLLSEYSRHELADHLDISVHTLHQIEIGNIEVNDILKRKFKQWINFDIDAYIEKKHN